MTSLPTLKANHFSPAYDHQHYGNLIELDDEVRGYGLPHEVAIVEDRVDAVTSGDGAEDIHIGCMCLGDL